MSELCFVLCGPFLYMLAITENTSWENVKCLNRRIPKTLLALLSPATSEGRNTQDKLILIEENIRMRLSRVTRKLKVGKDLKQTTRQAKHGDKTTRADGYVDNSPLRSELTTYPQPLKERLAHTDKAISSWVTHKPPPDLC
jgi:hypothetical protein